MELHEYQIKTGLKRDQVDKARQDIVSIMLKRFGKTEDDVMFLMDAMNGLFDLGEGIGKLEAVYAEIHRTRTGKYPDDYEQTQMEE